MEGEGGDGAGQPRPRGPTVAANAGLWITFLLKGANKRIDAAADRILDARPIGLRFEAEQMAQVVLPAHQPDELLGGQARLRDFE